MGATSDVLGACETVVVKVVELVMKELTLDKLDTVGIGSTLLGQGRRGRMHLFGEEGVW